MTIILAGVVVLAAIGCVVVYKIGFKRGIEHRKQIAEAQFISAEEKAKAEAEAKAIADRLANPTTEDLLKKILEAIENK